MRESSSVVYQLKVTLRYVKPPVWRRLLVEDCSLDDLHEIIQVAMGWDNYHLFAFRIDTLEFTRADMDAGEMGMDDATSTLLSDVIRAEKQKFRYQYDFGDDWQHEIVVEKIMPSEQMQAFVGATLSPPVCIKGSRACPPEDVGGPWGYAKFLEGIANPKHEDHEQFLEWRGEFNPEEFDLDGVNRKLWAMFQ